MMAFRSALNLTKAVTPRLLETVALPVVPAGLAWGRSLLAKASSTVKNRPIKTNRKSSLFIKPFHDIFKLRVMSKKIIIILAVILLLLLLGSIAGYFFFLRDGDSDISDKAGGLPDIIKEKVEGDLIYEDAAGFSFKYPKAIEVKDITPDDEVYYTLLSLTKDKEKLTVTAKDIKEASSDSFIKNTPEYKLAQVAGATSLGGLAAKQYTLAGKLITVVVDKGVLYLIEGPAGSYWEDVQSLLISTFAFAGTTGSQTQIQDNAIYEEEIIE